MAPTFPCACLQIIREREAWRNPRSGRRKGRAKGKVRGSSAFPQSRQIAHGLPGMLGLPIQSRQQSAFPQSRQVAHRLPGLLGLPIRLLGLPIRLLGSNEIRNRFLTWSTNSGPIHKKRTSITHKKRDNTTHDVGGGGLQI